MKIQKTWPHRVCGQQALNLGRVFFFLILSIHFLAALGLHCYKGFSLVAADERGLLCSCDTWAFTAVILLLHSVGSRPRGLQYCSTWAQRLRLPGSGAQAQQLWPRGLVALQHVDLPRSGIEPVSPALAGRFSTTEPPGKPPRAASTWLSHTFTTSISSPTCFTQFQDLPDSSKRISF